MYKCIKCGKYDNSTYQNVTDLGYEYEQYPHYHKEWNNADNEDWAETCICKNCLLAEYELWDEVPYKMFALPNSFGSYNDNGRRRIGIYGMKFNRDKWAWIAPINVTRGDFNTTVEVEMPLKDIYDISGVDETGDYYIEPRIRINNAEHSLMLFGNEMTIAFRTPKEIKEVALCDL